ncbi:ABC transporter ATP-binding protein [Salinirubellus salinus]|uniref:Molybdate/tungstate import ATP-binding protein WtpC n=1 Tax=Salinirubellus salinus TaxID=1364945 RepID=A0A9E7R7X0_9EURY|nr:ABC transporter ATP-binding protein [Salinirubellus salinus]UWM56243.1 ABC transporter ATP-binding protein [Salinirubellus salinus]
MSHDSVAVELEDVSVRYGGVTALDSVSLSVAPGEFFTLVGPSGCGKTTTLRVLAGLERPTEGTVRVDGEDVTDRPPEDRNVGIVFQSYALFNHMNVRENVGYGLRFRDPPDDRSPAARVEHLLDLVDLGGMGDRDPTELSGGQRQRVALARALAPGPDLLLLDEPLSALDARLRERLRVTVRRIQRELGTTTVYVTHDQAEALAVSDRVAVMNAGRIEQVGRPETVYRRPASRFVAAFVGDNNLLDAEVTTDGAARLVDDTAVTVPLPELADRPAGDRVTLSVRPEAFTLGEGVVTLPVSVENVEFLGESYRLHCAWAGRELLVRSRDRATGDIEVGFDPAEGHLL